jgi:hypothetical protein
MRNPWDPSLCAAGASLTAAKRAEIEAELEALELDLVRRRKRLAYWTTRKAQAATMPDLPADLHAKTIHFHGRALDLVMSGEKLAAILRRQLTTLPAYETVFH